VSTDVVRGGLRSQNMYYLFLFRCNIGYENAPQCYVLRTLHVWLYFESLLRTRPNKHVWPTSSGMLTYHGLRNHGLL
jgi:hypothetical protein